MTPEYYIAMEIQGEQFYVTQDPHHVTRSFAARGIWTTYDDAEQADLIFWLSGRAHGPALVAPEVAGFGMVVRPAGQSVYLTADGCMTRDRRLRGHWTTRAEAESAMRAFILSRLQPHEQLAPTTI